MGFSKYVDDKEYKKSKSIPPKKTKVVYDDPPEEPEKIVVKSKKVKRFSYVVIGMMDWRDYVSTWNVRAFSSEQLARNFLDTLNRIIEDVNPRAFCEADLIDLRKALKPYDPCVKVDFNRWTHCNYTIDKIPYNRSSTL